MDSLILNAGLDLAMAFGEHWMEPIQKRLAVVQPQLTPDELNQYDAHSRQAMKRGHDLVPDCFRDAKNVQREAYLLFEKRLLKEYSWVSGEMSSRLFSQGCYYAWKDGNMP
jgi:hypothetical protein